MRTLILVILLLCLSIAMGCSVPKKRSWAERKDGVMISAHRANEHKRTWKKRSFPQDSVRMAANRKSIWIKTNRALEDMALAEGRFQGVEPEPVEIEAEISPVEEFEALSMANDWENPTAAAVQPALTGKPAELELASDFPITVNSQVELYLDLFQGTLRPHFRKWLARSGRYLSVMEPLFEAADLPRDLSYLSMIESGFSQRAYSKSKAVGLWQFMSATGQEYGLVVNDEIDERRGVEKPTQAAVAYLGDLYREFGDWYLAIAAYNGGPGRLRKAIRKAGSTDFWKIAQKNDLPLETKRYVPKLIAAILIAKEPEKYGFADITYEEPLSYETIDVGPGLSFEAVAMLTNSTDSIIRNLNQELLSGRSPVDLETYTMRIPAGSGDLAESNLSLLYRFFSNDYGAHFFASDEGLVQLFHNYRISIPALRTVDDLEQNELFASSRLRIPFNPLKYRSPLPEG